MSLLGYLLAFSSGLLTCYHVLFCFILIALLTLKRSDKRQCIILTLMFLFGFVFMFCSNMIGRFPFTKGVALVIDKGTNFIIVKTLLSRIYLKLPGHPYQVGDVVFLSGAQEPLFFPFLEGDFNYRQYLEHRGIYYMLTKTNVKVLLSSPLRFLNQITYHDHYPAFLEKLKERLLYNTRDYDDFFLNELANANILFIISLSGIHLSLIRRFMKRVSSIFFDDKNSAWISYLSLLPLYLLDITKFAFYRIFLTGMARYANRRFLKMWFNNLELNVVISFLFLIINPYLIVSPSFYLAYLLIFSFSLKARAKTLRGTCERILSLWLILIPYQLFSQQAMHFLSLLLPLFLTPLVAFWYVIYHVTLIIVPLQRVGINVLNLIYIILHFSTRFERSFFVATFSPAMLFLMTLCLCFLYYAYHYKIKPLRRLSLLSLGFFMLINHLPLMNHLKYGVTFLNVGQGDAILVNARGKHVLIDTGGLYERDISQEILIPYFRKHRIYALDYLFITHDDFDHSGGLHSLQSSFPVRHIIKEPSFLPLTLNQITFVNLNPGGYEDVNLNSLILYISFPSFHLLLMGDAGHQNEAALMVHYPELEVDYLKLGHHGSNSSTGDAFIRHYLPHTAIISCGYNNRYGHPHQDVLTTLARYNVQVRRTDLEGTIVIEKW